MINPPSNCVTDDRLEPPLGLLYITATLRENGYENVSVFDMTGCQNESDISNKIASICMADIYGISCFSTNYEYVKQIINHIKKINPTAYIVVGGPHPSGMPDFTLKDSNVDAVVVGEGEDIFSDAVTAFMKGSRLKGVFYGQGRADIDSYALPVRDLVDISTYSRKLAGQPVVSLLSSRGCVYHCIHCNSVVMGGGNRKVRYRSPDNVVEEIKTLRDTFIFYRFNDDHFTGNPDLEELLIKIKELDIEFRIFARIEDLNDTTCRLLKEAGCIHISVGLESLNYDNLKILGKKSQAGKEENVKIAKDHGLVVRSSFMVGLPYDNDQTINDSFQIAAHLGLDEFAVYPLIPYPGTTIWQYPERFGYKIIHSDFTDYIQMGTNGKTCYALQHRNFMPDDVRRWLQMATKLLKQGGIKHMSESRIAQ
jgi:radical SAM superfamily enzyme YgiQ (UPF0313 family)